MTPTTQNHSHSRNDPPTRQTIEREKRLQDANLIALRRMLAKTPGPKPLVLYSAA